MKWVKNQIKPSLFHLQRVPQVVDAETVPRTSPTLPHRPRTRDCDVALLARSLLINMVRLLALAGSAAAFMAPRPMVAPVTSPAASGKT